VTPGTADDRECVRLVAALLGSSRTAVCGKSRHPVDIRARRACYVALRRRGLSLPRIATELGGKDHTTILSGLRVSAAKDADDGPLASAVAEGVAIGTATRPRMPADTSNPREAIIGLLSVPGRVPDSTVRAIWVIVAALAGVPAETAAAC
jgi:hypothetical protein